MPRVRRMNATEVERILEQYHFSLISQKGSHWKWRNAELELQVIVPFHKSRDFPIRDFEKYYDYRRYSRN